VKANARNSIRLSTTSAVELLFTMNVFAEIDAPTVVAAVVVVVVTYFAVVVVVVTYFVITSVS